MRKFYHKYKCGLANTRGSSDEKNQLIIHEICNMVTEEGSEIDVRKEMKGESRGKRLQIKI